jgi:hypothetical protein
VQTDLFCYPEKIRVEDWIDAEVSRVLHELLGARSHSDLHKRPHLKSP